jgi:hypothetical protein
VRAARQTDAAEERFFQKLEAEVRLGSCCMSLGSPGRKPLHTCPLPLDTGGEGGQVHGPGGHGAAQPAGRAGTQGRQGSRHPRPHTRQGAADAGGLVRSACCGTM